MQNRREDWKMPKETVRSKPAGRLSLQGGLRTTADAMKGVNEWYKISGAYAHYA